MSCHVTTTVQLCEKKVGESFRFVLCPSQQAPCKRTQIELLLRELTQGHSATACRRVGIKPSPNAYFYQQPPTTIFTYDAFLLAFFFLPASQTAASLASQWKKRKRGRQRKKGGAVVAKVAASAAEVEWGAVHMHTDGEVVNFPAFNGRKWERHTHAAWPSQKREEGEMDPPAS